MTLLLKGSSVLRSSRLFSDPSGEAVWRYRLVIRASDGAFLVHQENWELYGASGELIIQETNNLASATKTFNRYSGEA